MNRFPPMSDQTCDVFNGGKPKSLQQAFPKPVYAFEDILKFVRRTAQRGQHTPDMWSAFNDTLEQTATDIYGRMLPEIDEKYTSFLLTNLLDEFFGLVAVTSFYDRTFGRHGDTGLTTIICDGRLDIMKPHACGGNLRSLVNLTWNISGSARLSDFASPNLITAILENIVGESSINPGYHYVLAFAQTVLAAERGNIQHPDIKPFLLPAIAVELKAPYCSVLVGFQDECCSRTTYLTTSRPDEILDWDSEDGDAHPFKFQEWCAILSSTLKNGSA